MQHAMQKFMNTMMHRGKTHNFAKNDARAMAQFAAALPFGRLLRNRYTHATIDSLERE